MEKMEKIISFLQSEIVLTTQKSLLSNQNQNLVSSLVQLLSKYETKFKQIKKQNRIQQKCQIKSKRIKKQELNSQILFNKSLNQSKNNSKLNAQNLRALSRQSSEADFGIPFPSQNNENNYNIFKQEEEDFNNLSQQKDEQLTEYGQHDETMDNDVNKDITINDHQKYKIEFIEL
ncbi:hypothetical protein TTHERM_00592820 (macronuclear) [Tetrahymena thermophila SB210]|uniref:Uncharacterized protein n=1 Tax=Tetrahymena thermophila (strain SB210) TaxID=312017 RepID=Q232L6_TETTS|nr:hypothetical protein TTHERM_00592820 [Tetrahymena thermophila SB210]EAR91396.2 hypothetical protein TTHERM_00592820 [Tetrahymena thermophila SB210]|eukprot:XP_001011641.2 hypothetical protein TTHERM_00592820 [Tetrahymena thermophila SB210]